MIAFHFVLGICLRSRWSPRFPHALHLIFLSFAKVMLSTLSPLMIWSSGQMALFLFAFGEGGSGTLANCSVSVALRPLFPFQQAQYVQVFPLKPAPFCTLFAGLGSTNKSATSFLLLSDSRSVLATLSFLPSFFLSQTLWQIWQERSSLASCSIRLQWVPRHLFLLGERHG